MQSDIEKEYSQYMELISVMEGLDDEYDEFDDDDMDYDNDDDDDMDEDYDDAFLNNYYDTDDDDDFGNELLFNMVGFVGHHLQGSDDDSDDDHHNFYLPANLGGAFRLFGDE